ncbi:hypothetical protein IGI04_009213 [Brassica rapa subsp. trilocularis]|uniref:Uncharacterized protein n=1 Tax=Brassica rapa subsp. trilocularis TaxID=1813537 RepID=A0ABQ7MZY8_BRACM|nr:hypothetical protein IGI04_009213 [Brassica rapa subsp. trilocularis]
MQVLNLQGGVGSSIIRILAVPPQLFCSSPVAPFFREDINISRGGDLMGVDMFLLDSQDDLKNAKSIVNWVLDYVTGPQFDFDPVKYEYCKQSPRQLYFSMKDGMTHLHR